jgi:hypothetical protein
MRAGGRSSSVSLAVGLSVSLPLSGAVACKLAVTNVAARRPRPSMTRAALAGRWRRTRSWSLPSSSTTLGTWPTPRFLSFSSPAAQRLPCVVALPMQTPYDPHSVDVFRG